MVETSIIIRAYNEAEYIGDVFEAIENQDYQDFEIILVDSGSTDGTLEIAEEYVDSIEFVSPQNFTFGYSCNVGCKAASGKYCSFLSAHAIPTDEQWLGTMIDNLHENEVAMTYSKQIGTETTNYSEHRLFNKLFPKEGRRQTPPDYWANNASSVIKKELWEEHNFDEYLTGHEDIEWAKHFMDQGYVVIYEADSCIYHIHDETWDQVFNRFEREAIADVEIGVKEPSDRVSEYLNLPKNILGDTVSAIRDQKFNKKILFDIIRFRYNQHMGTISGLVSEPDLKADRYEYYYDDANESVYLDSDGTISIKQSPLPNIRPNEVLIENEYVGVESEIRTPENKNNFPIIPNGHYVGTVAEMGANANSVEVGDVVVGETQYHCGVCNACNNGDHRNCINQTRIGIDTNYGAYSRYISVPSDYVYRLPENIDSRDGTLLPIVATILNKIEHIQAIPGIGTKCVVLGDTAKAELAFQVIDTVGEYSVTQLPTRVANNVSQLSDLAEFDIIIEGIGSTGVARKCIQNMSENSAILLLGTQYAEFNLTNQDVVGKTILKPRTYNKTNIPDSVNILHELNSETILQETYGLTEFQTAYDLVKNNQGLPLITPGTNV